MIFSARRTKKGAFAGFHARGSDLVSEIDLCNLIRVGLRDALPMFKALAIAGANRKGTLKVQINISEAGLDVTVRGGKPLDQGLEISLAQTAKHFSLARLCWEEEIITMRAPPIQRFGRTSVVPPPGAFLQAKTDGENSLLYNVKSIVEEARSVMDFLSGRGTFSLPLAETKEVHAVESEKTMSQATDTAWRKTEGLKN